MKEAFALLKGQGKPPAEEKKHGIGNGEEAKQDNLKEDDFKAKIEKLRRDRQEEKEREQRAKEKETEKEAKGNGKSEK